MKNKPIVKIIIACNSCGADLKVVETHINGDGHYIIVCEPCNCGGK